MFLLDYTVLLISQNGQFNAFTLQSSQKNLQFSTTMNLSEFAVQAFEETG